MKKILLIAFAVAAIVSCKKNVTGGGDNSKPFEPATPDKSAPMYLSVGNGGGAAYGVAGKAGGIGIRQTTFEAGDVIGVYAATVKFVNPSTYAPDWTEKLYFENKPASYAATGTAADTVAFKWGMPSAQGGLDDIQFYPAKDRSIYVYAYYPYTQNTTDSVKLDAITKVPSRFVSLVEGAVVLAGEPDEDKNVNLMQPDYMWAVGKAQKVNEGDPVVDTVRRTLRLDTLTFKHALAQLNFRIYLMDENATVCAFDSLVITVPKNGSYDLVTGTPKIIVDAVPTAAKDSVSYVITAKKGESIPAAIAGDKTNALDLLETLPLMVLPMNVDELKGCKIKLVVNYGKDGDTALRTYYVTMAQLGLKPVKQGSYNSIYMGVGQTEVTLNCNINPWGINDPADDSDLEVE